MTCLVNHEPWARTKPASADQVLKAIGAEFSAARQKPLQELADRNAALFAEYESSCSPAAIEQSRERENQSLSDSSTTAQSGADIVLKERSFRDAAPIIERKLNQERSRIRKQFFPACAELCRKLVAEIDAQLANLPEFDVATRWKITTGGDFFNVIRYPLLRLRSMAEYDLTEVYGPGRVALDANLSPEYLLTAAGLISTQKSTQ